MNEQKKSYNDYKNPNISEQKQNSTDLAAQVISFVGHTKLNIDDWEVLTRIIKQLNKPEFNASRKVLRSMQTKFETIRNKYQR